MSAAGVDTTIFKSHSARSAGTYEAAAQDFLSKIFCNVQIGPAQQLLRNSIRNQFLLFVKILSLMCLLCEGLVRFSLSCFEHTLFHILEVLRNEIRSLE